MWFWAKGEHRSLICIQYGADVKQNSQHVWKAYFHCIISLFHYEICAIREEV